MMRRCTGKIVLLAALVMLVAACEDRNGPAAAQRELLSRQLVPTDKALAAIYLRSCRSCHTVAATGSPLTGDRAAWAPRMAKGMEVMLNSVISGFGGMPPLGLCMDCSPDQFESLIRFMAQTEHAP
ncbi:MAG: cytochrome c5 family protein [Halioglobus sp.]|nr:cytochrome c5 family protein [Halioglobus sp.]